MFLMRLRNSTDVPITRKKKKKIPLIFLQAWAIDQISFSIMILASHNYENKITKYTDYCVTGHAEEAGKMCVQCASALERQQSWYIAILVDVHASAGCSCVGFLLRHSSGRMKPPAADMLGFYFCQEPTQRFCTTQLVLDRKLVSKQNKASI